MLLRYERLPEYYFQCSYLGHHIRECPSEESSEAEANQHHQYGAWMKASSPVHNRRQQQDIQHYEDGDLPSTPMNMKQNLGSVPLSPTQSNVRRQSDVIVEVGSGSVSGSQNTNPQSRIHAAPSLATYVTTGHMDGVARCMAEIGHEPIKQSTMVSPSCMAIPTKESLHGYQEDVLLGMEGNLLSVSVGGMDMNLECTTIGHSGKNLGDPISAGDQSLTVGAARGRKSKWKRLARGVSLSSVLSTEGVKLGKRMAVSLGSIRKSLPTLSDCKWDDHIGVIDVLVFYKKVLRIEEFQELVVVLWRIWYRRNSFVHGNRAGLDEELVLWCRSFLAEYLSAATKKPSAAVSKFTRWIPPANEHFKLNTDTSLSQALGTASLGVVIRHSQGYVLLSAVKSVVGGFSPEIFRYGSKDPGWLCNA
ncbi:hypothetical protein ACOSQ4_016505 [Xanthoceras sorbifolium]